MRLALAIASFVILIVHGLVFYNQFFHRWERHQTAYFDQARAMAKTDAERAGLEGRSPRIEQIIVTRFGDNRVDRCTTCHIGNDDPRFKEHAQPLRSHPYLEELGDKQVNGKWERRHKFSDFGCTVCHDGQGRGLDTFDAHGEDHYWPGPLLGYVTQNWRADFKPKLKDKTLMQANCAQCHTEDNFKSTPLVARGRQLFFEKNCYGCHKIEGLSAGTLGPELSEVGKKFKPDYLWESIVEPRANSATSFMPKFDLKDDEVKALVVFLKSRRGINFAETSLDRYRAGLNKGKEGSPTLTTAAETTPKAESGASASLIALGNQLVNDRSCLACHKLGNRDGGIAPDLSFEGLMKDETWTMQHFRDPRSRITDSIMPSFSFPDAEFQAMTAYLTSLKTPPVLNDPSGTFSTLCARCHGELGNGKGMISVYLDPYPRDLTKAGFMNSKTEERLMKSIREGVAGTSMPAWGRVLNDEQIRGVLDHIQKNFVKDARRPIKPRQVPETNPVQSSAESIKRGEQIFLQRCTGCHGKKADGKGPNSLDIQPRPRNLRNAAFMSSISDRRLFESLMYGVQGTAMPPWADYGLTQKDIGDLVNYLRSFNQAKK
ncbi:MAG TPA: c-type cytochrome [Blastocatellia bacterium]|nr:c-type cytochrome [Blastocatellia bacterium]HMX26136.1 c-type cytochrome [Blastocatellia bacterium]HNG31062.1 c-type cytochrome [Blastocatellia bacterium]